MKHPFLLLFAAALCGSLACAANTMVNFGFPRYPERDGVDWLAGMQVAINEANERGMVPGYNFSLVLATIPACTSSDFYVCMAQAEAAGADFLSNMSSMSAVLTPDWWITESVMAAARPLNMPVISPKTFGHTDTEQAIFLNQRIDSDIPHTLAYMFGAHECARTGLIMTKYLITFDKVYDIQRSFKYGGYPTPPMILTNATNAEMLHFILGDDPDRLCFVMQVTIDELYVIMDLLRNDARFSTEKYSFFSVGGMETTTYSSGGNTMVYDSLYITRHVPSFRSNTSATREFLAAFDLWTASSARDRDILTYLPGDVAPTQPSETAFFTYLATRYLVELVRIASLSHRHLGTLPSPSELLEVAYNVRTYVGGIVYQPLIRRCPDEPLPQVCFCNVAARTTYTFKVNGTTGRPYQVHDDASIGEVGVATTVLSADVCSPPTIDNANYPITISLIIPSDGMYVEMVKGISRVLGGIVSALNTITPAPSRPFRIYRTEATLAEITNEFQETISRQVQPFITLLNMGGSLNVSSTLLVYPNADIQPLEDRPLRKYQYGDENLLATIPSGADSLHALVAYYSQSPPGKFTGISAFATTEAEAAVMRKSLHTFQIDIPIVVVTDASLFVSTLVGLTSASSNQFVLVCAINNNPLVAAIIAARNQHAGGVIAVATWEGALTQVPDFDTIIGDVLFTSFITEWWTPTSSIRRFINNSGSKSPYEGNDPALYMSAITFGFSYLIAQQATAASSSAASLLYQIGTVSVADVTFGPYSNASCTDKQIAENDRDRSCQCYKGPRTFYVHSLMDLNDKTESQRTGRYRYSITTCGVVYHPYIPPPDLSSSMSDGLVAGIIVAAVVLIIIAVVGALLSVLCFFGKKNRYAPKDSSKPFAMVFTDIQNSTGLWARTPAAMSLSVSIHHDLIRTLIKKYSGYEVKTIGDSFMIAFKDVNKATLLALDIQTLFYNSEWPSDIDATYAELISEAVSDDPKLAIAMMSCEEQYKQLWKGIRVRVGIHYGLGDIRKDPVSLGFDYYGTVVNTAARVEGVGHGGQVLLTEAAFDALDPTFVTKYKVQVIDLGMQPLRGLDTEVQLRQLLPSPFAGRRFPALRLDIEHVAIAEVENSDVSGSDTTDEILPPDQMAQRISNMPGMKIDPETILKYYNFLSVGFSAAPEKWRKGAIKELGKAWNVEVHHSPNSMMRGLMQMAIKMDRAARAKGGRRGSSNYTGSTKNGTEYLRANTNRSFHTPLVDPSKQSAIVRQASNDVSVFSVPSSPAGAAVRNEGNASPFEANQ